MSNATPIPPDPTPGPSPRPDDPPPDARGFFRRRYELLALIPKGRTKADVDAFVAEHGTTTGYTREELSGIAKQVRAEMRKEQGTEPETEEEPSTTDPRAWEKWIRGIGFGVYVLATIGLFFYAVAIRKLTSWAELRPYVVGIVIGAVLLLILDLGMRLLRNVPNSEWIARWIAVGIAVMFLVVAGAAVFWLVVFVLRDAGIITTAGSEPAPIVTAPPKEFTFVESGTYSDNKRLPDDIFGPLADDIGKPRAWMRNLELGSYKMLEAPGVHFFWLMTNESANTEHTAFINVGTEDDVVILAFLVVPKGAPENYATLSPLKQKFSADRAQYLFSVPRVEKPGRLLVFVAMTEVTFKKWHGQRQKFLIRSQPL